MDKQNHPNLDEDGEFEDDLAYRKGRRKPSPYRRGGYSPIIGALIGAVGTIIAALVAIIIPVGSESKPLICNIVGSTWAICDGSITIVNDEIEGTQIALEKRETLFAQAQTAVVPTQLATDPISSPTFTLTLTETPRPLSTSTIASTHAFMITPTIDWGSIVQVASGKIWQDTGIELGRGTRVLIEVIDGEWRNSPNAPYTHGEGTGYICGRAMTSSDCVETIPEFPSDALIGRVGDQLFYVGQRTTVIIDQAGMLSLRINDGDYDVWDNDGILTVGIAILD